MLRKDHKIQAKNTNNNNNMENLLPSNYANIYSFSVMKTDATTTTHNGVRKQFKFMTRKTTKTTQQFSYICSNNVLWWKRKKKNIEDGTVNWRHIYWNQEGNNHGFFFLIEKAWCIDLLNRRIFFFLVKFRYFLWAYICMTVLPSAIKLLLGG